VYQYTVEEKLGPWQPDMIGPQKGEYVIMTGPDGKNNGDLLQESSPTIQPEGLLLFY